VIVKSLPGCRSKPPTAAFTGWREWRIRKPCHDSAHLQMAAIATASGGADLVSHRSPVRARVCGVEAC